MRAPVSPSPPEERRLAAAEVPLGRRSARDPLVLAALLLLALLTWLPRLRGPIDLRYDAGVYYVLGTSLAEGHGYRLLSEPGAIQAIQYPPLLPLFVALHQWVAGSSDPAAAGHWLRISFLFLFLGYIAAVYLLGRRWLSPAWAATVALISLFHIQAIWISDLLHSELPFALLSVLFLLAAGRSGHRFGEWAAGAAAVAAFLTRSVGVALLGAWVGESVFRRRWRQAALRALVAAVPVLAWQGYIAQVKASPGYAEGAYAYQRAPYQFYNVGYLENLGYVDPFVPELGRTTVVGVARRIGANLVSMPAGLGGAIGSNTHWTVSKIEDLNAVLGASLIPVWIVLVPLVVLGVGSLAGLVLLAVRGRWLIPLYAFGSIALITLTPWPGQFDRYLAPLTPVLALALFIALLSARERLRAAKSARWRTTGKVLVPAVAAGVLFLQLVPLYKVFTRHLQTVVYRDRSGGAREQKLFFFPPAWQDQRAAVEWLGSVAPPGAIVATSTPHWAYLITGLRAVMPPFEADPATEQQLLDAVPVDYLIVDELEFLNVTRRYAAPAVRRYPDRWQLVFSRPGNGSRIYRRVGPAGSTASR